MQIHKRIPLSIIRYNYQVGATDYDDAIDLIMTQYLISKFQADIWLTM